MRLALAVALGACNVYGGEAATPDAYSPQPPDCTVYQAAQLTCVAGQATGDLEDYTSSGTAHCPGNNTKLWTATCAQGCALQGGVEIHEGRAPAVDVLPIRDPGVLCAERAPMKVGDPCTDWCLPTRVELAADGTVSGQTYLACTGGTCAAAPPPTIPLYLQPCPSYVLSWVTPPATGYVIVVEDPDACLMAWDAQASQYVTGQTSDCIGDWQCPAGALCDDALIDLSSTGELHGVCKPGPRGTLTPAMLTR